MGTISLPVFEESFIDVHIWFPPAVSKASYLNIGDLKEILSTSESI